MYFKTSEQQFCGRKLGCYLHYFQYQMRCYRYIFKFSYTRIRKCPSCYINLLYQVLTFYNWKSLSNLKIHLRLLKSIVANSILKLPRKKFQQLLLYCILENWTFAFCKKNDLSYLPNQIYDFPGQTWSSIFFNVKGPGNVSITYNIFDCVHSM